MKALGGAGPAPLLNEAAMDRVTLQTRNGGKGRQGGIHRGCLVMVQLRKCKSDKGIYRDRLHLQV